MFRDILSFTPRQRVTICRSPSAKDVGHGGGVVVTLCIALRQAVAIGSSFALRGYLFVRNAQLENIMGSGTGHLDGSNV